MSSAEIEVIGQILGKPSKLQQCDLRPDDFYSTQLREIYEVILELNEQKISIDPLSVAERLETITGRNWLTTVMEVEQKAFCYSSFDKQIEKVRRDGQILNIRDKLSGCIYEMERTKSLDHIDTLIQELMQTRSSRVNHSHTIQAATKAALNKLEELHEKGELPGITTGLKKLDEAIGGYRDTNLVVVGARPAMGKTAFLLNTALAAAEKLPVGIISAEQDHEQVASRLFSIAGNIDSQKVRTGSLNNGDWPLLSSVASRLIKMNIHINDKPAIDILTVIKQARDWKYKYGIRALYVDYIQKIRSSRNYQFKRDAVGEVVGSLKDLARELKIPVVALAQVKREVDSRPDPRPGMADLADSSEIEKEADEVMTIYRDEVYNENSNQKGIAEILVCKARHGCTGVAKVQWNGPFMKFSDLELRY